MSQTTFRSLSRRRFTLATLGGAMLPTFAATGVLAQETSGKPITVIVPYAPGGSADLATRVVTQFAAPILGNPVVVDNRVGGGGVVGWGAAARAPKDGNVLVTLELSYAIAVGLLDKFPFNPQTAFAQIGTAVKAPHILVINPQVPAKNVAELVKLLKDNPGKYNYGSGGNGTNTHLAGELFKSVMGVDVTHIPYRGAGAVLADLMSGQVHMLITSVSTALPFIQSGKLRALMITGDNKVAALPDVPNAKQLGHADMDIDYWVGFAAPNGTQKERIDAFNRATLQALKKPDAAQKLQDMGFNIVANTPAQAEALVKSEIQRWSALIKKAGITAS